MGSQLTLTVGSKSTTEWKVSQKLRATARQAGIIIALTQEVQSHTIQQWRPCTKATIRFSWHTSGDHISLWQWGRPNLKPESPVTESGKARFVARHSYGIAQASLPEARIWDGDLQSSSFSCSIFLLHCELWCCSSIISELTGVGSNPSQGWERWQSSYILYRAHASTA